MAFKPAINLFCDVSEVTSLAQWAGDDGWQGTDCQWQITLSVQPQLHGSVETPNWQSYDGTDIKVGMWIGSISNGAICRITNILSQAYDIAVVEIEDVDRVNILSDYTQSGFGGISDGLAFVFDLNENGEPVWGNLAYSNTILTGNYAFFTDIAAKFKTRNAVQTYIPGTQIAHTFVVGDIIQLSGDGTFILAIADTQDNAEKVLGVVSSVGIPSVDNFSYRPIGRYVKNLNLTGIGSVGDVLYLDNTIPGTITATKPAISKPIYIKINDTTGMIVTGGSGGGGSAASEQRLYDDISAQIDGVLEVFTVSEGNYIAGTLTINIGGIINDKDVHYFEEDPATGQIRFIVAPTLDDAPIVAQYQYTTV